MSSNNSRDAGQIGCINRAPEVFRCQDGCSQLCVRGVASLDTAALMQPRLGFSNHAPEELQQLLQVCSPRVAVSTGTRSNTVLQTN